MPVFKYGPQRSIAGRVTYNKRYLFFFFQDNRIKNLTYRLKSTQDELKSLKDQLATQMVALWNTTISTTVQLNRLKGVWIAVNTTAEKTSNLTAKVGYVFHFFRHNLRLKLLTEQLTLLLVDSVLNKSKY